jgi:hypothetical protein
VALVRGFLQAVSKSESSEALPALLLPLSLSFAVNLTLAHVVLVFGFFWDEDLDGVFFSIGLS